MPISDEQRFWNKAIRDFISGGAWSEMKAKGFTLPEAMSCYLLAQVIQAQKVANPDVQATDLRPAVSESTLEAAASAGKPLGVATVG